MDLLHHLFRPKGTVAGDKGAESGNSAAADETKRAVPNWRLEQDETKLTRYTPFAPIAEAPPGDLVLLLEDVLPRVPTSALKAGLHSPEQRLCFSADDLFTGLAKGRVTIALSVLAERYPEIFEKPARPEEDVQVSLPLQKLIQQVAQTEGQKLERKEAPPVAEAHLVEERGPVEEATKKPASEPKAGSAIPPSQPAPAAHIATPEPPATSVEAKAPVAAPSVSEKAAEKPGPPIASQLPLEERKAPAAESEAEVEESPAPNAPSAQPVLVTFAPEPRPGEAPAAAPAPTPSASTKPAPAEPMAAEAPAAEPEAISAVPLPAPPGHPHLDPPSLLRPTVTVNELFRMSPPVELEPSPALEPPRPEATKPAPIHPEPSPPQEPAPKPPPSIPIPFAKPSEPLGTAPAFRGPPTPPLIRAPALNIPAGVQARVAEPAETTKPPPSIPIPRPSFAPPVEPEPPRESVPEPEAQRPEPPGPPVPPAKPAAAEAPPAQPEPAPSAEPEAKAATAETPPSVSEPEPVLQEGQIAATTIHEDEPPPAERFSLDRIDLEPLQAIFMTDEQLDLPRISELSARLPGISGCLILAGETMTQGGERPSGLDSPTLRELSRQLASTVDSFKNKLPAEPMFTLYGGNRALSIFARGVVSVCVVHATRGFLPGVRERLNAVADTLARGAEDGEDEQD